MLVITTLFLVAVFLAAEFYRFRRRIEGSVREIRTLDEDPTGLTGARIQVMTSEAGEVSAFVSGCQMCISPLEVGEAVLLVPGPKGYVLKPSWISRRGHGDCPKGVAK